MPDRYLAFPASRSTAGVGRAADPGGPGVPVPQLRRSAARSRSTPARPAPRSPNCRWRPGTASAPPNRGCDTARRRRRGAAGPVDDADGQPPMLPGADRRLLRTRRPAADAVARASTAARRRATPSTSSSRASPTAARWSADDRPTTDVTFAVLDVAPEPYAVTPVLTARVAVDGDRRRTRCTRIALRCQVRIEPQRRALRRRRGRRPARPVRRRASAGPTRSGRSCGCTPPRWCRASPAPPTSTWRWRAPTTSRWPAEVPARAARRHGAAAVPVQRHRLHPRAARLRRRSRCRGTARTGYDMPVAVWRDLMRAALPGQPAGCGSTATPSPRSPATARHTAALAGTRP